MDASRYLTAEEAKAIDELRSAIENLNKALYQFSRCADLHADIEYHTTQRITDPRPILIYTARVRKTTFNCTF